MKAKKSIYISLIIALVILVLLNIVPRVPSKEKIGTEDNAQGMVLPDMETIDKELDLIADKDSMLSTAIGYLSNQEGGETMKGVFMLRAISKRYPKYRAAHFYLGLASLQSNQAEKALERFEEVIRLSDTFDVFSYNSFMYLDETYYNLGLYEKELSSLNEWKSQMVQQTEDTVSIKRIEKKIELIDSLLTN